MHSTFVKFCLKRGSNSIIVLCMIYNFEFLGCVCFRFVIIRSTMDVDKEFFAESSGCLQLVFFVHKYSIDDTIL